MINSSIYLMLQEFDILQSLTKSEMEDLSGAASLQRLDKNALLYERGDLKNNVYIIRKGCLKLALERTKGRSLIKDIVYENTLVGENIFAGSDVHQESAIAIEETYVIKFDKEKFLSLIESNDVFCQEIMSLILTRLSKLEQRVQSFIFNKAERRIVDFVKRIGEQRGSRTMQNEIHIQHALSHKEIAKLTDTSRQTVTRVFNELKRCNIIHFRERRPNDLVIKDMLRLA